MPKYKVETMEKWNKLSAWLKENSFRLWQMQYSWYDKNGFHAWFWLADKEDVEIVTHNEEIQSEILRYKLL